MPTRSRLAYESGGVRLPFDLFRPETDDVRPLVVCLHGGGWISGDPSDMREVALGLAAAGYVAAAPAYRLAPLHPFPAAVQDVHTFLATIRHMADELRFDPNKVATLGNSAGGHLSAMCGATTVEPAYRANAVVAICPITDVCDPRASHYPICWSFLEQFMARPFEGNQDFYRSASPVYQVGPDSPPYLIVHGEADDVVPPEQSERLEAALKRVGVCAHRVSLPGEGHSFTYGGWAAIERGYLAFLKEVFGDA
ncbi:MAG: alpha/beta hydrolase [Fimbriimonadaceae bacterium]|nr:alpha/beta hydrolase [Fimbriimonadaceae bacterium]